jgi:hypothetical protein
MKFFAEPNHYVRVTNKNLRTAGYKSGITFDSNGVFETDNPRLIEALKVHFKCEDDAVILTPVEEIPEEVIEEVAEEVKPKTKRRGK